MFIPVDEPSDPRLDDYRNIPDAELIGRRGIFIAEGRVIVTRLMRSSRFTLRSVMVTEPARQSLAQHVDEASGLPIYLVPQSLMNGIAGFNVHRGCLAVGERRGPDAWPDVVASARTVVVAERVANADNVGGLFRNAAALGGDAVLLDPASTDPLYRKAIRTSMGASLEVPFARLEPWPHALHALRASGFTLVGMTPASDADRLTDVAATLRQARVAIVLGHEGDGLTESVLAACDVHVRIPMANGIDSLNVATAAAIALYEFTT